MKSLKHTELNMLFTISSLSGSVEAHDALKLLSNDRAEWLSRMRQILLETGGHGRVLRSVAHMKASYGYKSTLAGDARKTATLFAVIA